MNEYRGTVQSKNIDITGSINDKNVIVGDIRQTLLKGVGIKNITQIVESFESNGENIWNVSLTDGRNILFSIRNGSQGKQGEPGEEGKPFTYDMFTEEQLLSLKGTKGENGKSPYYDQEEAQWYEYDDSVQSYVPSKFTGIGEIIGITNPATSESLGAVKVGENLKITEDGVLSVDTASSIYDDNTKPITSAAVFREIGNIEALLQII